MNLRSTSSSPKPEVLYLPAIFRAIRSGEIRIPAFQRGFVWKPSQVIELLESVYRGFPIGSLLFWRAPVEAMLSDLSGEIPFPHPHVAGEVDFVLDGMQRLASLYGAFNEPDSGETSDQFAIVFDLRAESFVRLSECNEHSILLRKLFSPRSLLEEQARLGKLKAGEQLVDRTLDLQRIFQEYLIPVTRISGTPPEEVVQIFERVNNTGTKLSAIDFMRAQTWSQSFDLSEQIAVLSDSIEHLRFEVPYDTIAKTIALSLDIAPTGEQMVKLREKSDDELFDAIARTSQALIAAISFFREHLHLQSYDFIPYEGQFLVAASIALEHGRELPPWFGGWFWTVGFSEALQGRPDHAIARLAIEARHATPAGIPEVLSLTLGALMTRGIRKGGALGMTFVASIASRGAASVLTGSNLPSDVMTSGFETRMLGAIFEQDQLLGHFKKAPRTEKRVCNVILLGPEERGPGATPSAIREGILKLSNVANSRMLLESQCLSGDCIEAIAREDVPKFFTARARAIKRLAVELSGRE